MSPHRHILGAATLALLLFMSLATDTDATAESLYSESSFRPLTADNKAHRVNDLITIQVYENSSASTSTDTNTQRSNNLSAGVNNLFSGKQTGASLSQSGTFDGGGTTQRANKLLVTLSVSVREILPNGDLKVAGEQLLTVNGEQHKVNLEGRVRPHDVSTDNVVLSTRLADAHIDYIGDGDLSERQKRSWWRKLLDWIGL